MNINKGIAEEVAIKLLSEKLTVIDEIAEKRQDFATKKVMDSLPALIRDAYKAHPSYFSATTTCYFEGVGITRTQEASKEWIPNNHTRVFILEGGELNEYVALVNTHINLSKEYLELKEEIVATLCAMRSYKRIQTDFPEAYTLLPDRQTTALTVNIDKLRCKLDLVTCE